MSTDPEALSEVPPPRRFRLVPTLIVSAIVLVVLARVALHFGAEITVKSAFYEGIGMGDVYSKRWHTNVFLGGLGFFIGLLFAVPALLMWRMPKLRPGGSAEPPLLIRLIRTRVSPGTSSQLKGVAALRALPLVILLVVAVAFASSISGRMVSLRDQLFALTNATSFGVSDPVFDRDIGFYVFSLPALNGLVGILASGLVFALITTAAITVARVSILLLTGYPRAAHRIAARLRPVLLVLTGGLVMTAGIAYWLSRYALVIGGDEIVAGAGAATRDIDIPTRSITAIFIVLVGLAVMSAAMPTVWRRLTTLTRKQLTMILGGIWTALALLLVIVASPWFIVLLLPAVGMLALAFRADQFGTQMGGPAPGPALPVAIVATCIALTILGPVGAALNDAIALRGTRLQVERPNIEATLNATRAATGLDAAEIIDAPYRRSAVTRQAINAASASVSSVRFLDIPPTGEACSRLQTFNQFYTCNDVDVDRYVLNGQRRTVFGIGREIDYDKLPDFQRRHFTYTHGYGLILAPVNEIERNTGRPVWAAGGIPQRGITFEGDNGAIYFGAQRNMPWAMVSTQQSVFNRLDSASTVEWSGTSGIRVGSGWRRLAITEYLGGLPYIGGGRQVWNATGGNPADENSKLLLFRDITSRVNEIAPFMDIDDDPYFVAEGGRLYVMAPMYATTDQYPYAASLVGDVRYLRQSVMAVMDAYSGETSLYVLDDDEPITAVWRSVYPDLFKPVSDLSPQLRRHLRLGETGLNVLADATRRFHVTDTDTFYNGDEAWAPTEEAYGPGVQGTSIVSPIRYTYAVLPGDTEERFVAIQSYKPAVRGRGIGFSGWLAVVNDPGDAEGTQFGRTILLRFRPDQNEPLDSLDTFTGNVAKDETLSSEIGIRKDSVVRGNTIVVPVGRGLLYVQPLYLDSTNDSLPTLWKVIVSFGDGRVFSAPTLEQALSLALNAEGNEDIPNTSAGSTSSSSQSISELVQRANDEFDAYQRAFGEGDFDAASGHLKAFRAALARAKALADRQGQNP